jgi:hypothetical protein
MQTQGVEYKDDEVIRNVLFGGIGGAFFGGGLAGIYRAMGGKNLDILVGPHGDVKKLNVMTGGYASWYGSNPQRLVLKDQVPYQDPAFKPPVISIYAATENVPLQFNHRNW